MRPNRYSVQKKGIERSSWLGRYSGSLVLGTLLFSSFAYALVWPTVPGEIGYPIEGSFWNYFQKMLVDTGATSDGTVRKSASLGVPGGATGMTVNTLGNLGVGTGSDTTYTMSVSGKVLLSDTAMGVAPTATGHLATKGYVDAQVVSAAGGGGGYGQCYRIKNSTPAYPTCASGYTRAYASYGTSVGSSPLTVNFYFENNIGGAWFQNFGHVYLYYTYDAGTNAFNLYDDQDVNLAGGSVINVPSINGTFSSLNSTYMSYTTVSPTTMNNYGNFTQYGYAVCCK